MLHKNSTENPSSTGTLFAFKPRQVLLAEHNQRSKMTKDEDAGKVSASITPKMKEILHQSILDYLHRNGFSKTLKRFQSEAQVEDDTWKVSSLHLEDMYCQYLDARTDSDANLKSSKKEGDDGNAKKEDSVITKKDGKHADEDGTTKKKKKKGSIDNDSAIEDKSKATDKNLGESETKPKKKKSKHEFESHGRNEEVKADAPRLNGSVVDDSTEKPKDKKKTGQQEKLPSSVETNEEKDKIESGTTKTETVTKHKEKKKKKKTSTDSAAEEEQVNPVKTDNENGGVQPDDTKEEKKSSKKRKRIPSDENENQSTEMITVEDSKRQKTKESEEASQDNEVLAKKTSNKQLDEHTNGKLDKNEVEKSGSQKSTRKERNGSTEPKTVNAFQRVKIDQVEFAHEKLQDNSYWAKDGAEIGYGAKAQEVLGQVRGRDFRHEKTKKKRGSYRGGQIDLQSHSIKFNYSDEE